MNFTEYLDFLLDIRIECIKYKRRIIVIHEKLLFGKINPALEELEELVSTPNNKILPQTWLYIAEILGRYFGKAICKMVFNKTYEEMQKILHKK